MNVQAIIINTADKKKITAEIIIDLCDLTAPKTENINNEKKNKILS